MNGGQRIVHGDVFRVYIASDLQFINRIIQLPRSSVRLTQTGMILGVVGI